MIPGMDELERMVGPQTCALLDTSSELVRATTRHKHSEHSGTPHEGFRIGVRGQRKQVLQD